MHRLYFIAKYDFQRPHTNCDDNRSKVLQGNFYQQDSFTSTWAMEQSVCSKAYNLLYDI